MKCDTCNNSTAQKVKYYYEEGVLSSCCDKCGSLSSTWIPDVYWSDKQKTYMNITDRMGNPIELRSRQHKAQVMRDMGISEAGDRYHGSLNGSWRSPMSSSTLVAYDRKPAPKKYGPVTAQFDGVVRRERKHG